MRLNAVVELVVKGVVEISVVVVAVVEGTVLAGVDGATTHDPAEHTPGKPEGTNEQAEPSTDWPVLTQRLLKQRPATWHWPGSQLVDVGRPTHGPATAEPVATRLVEDVVVVGAKGVVGTKQTPAAQDPNVPAAVLQADPSGRSTADDSAVQRPN